MVFWRISRHRDLQGRGGLKADGRWHYSGQPVVYLSENPASALLEVCVHTSANDIPPEFTLLRIEGPDIAPGEIALGALPANWPAYPERTRTLGTDWLQKNNAVLLHVPSAIVPYTTNFLFNPLHRDARRFSIAEAFNYPFDVRIKR